MINFIGPKFYLLVILSAEFTTWIILKICLNNINLNHNFAILIGPNIHYTVPQNIQVVIAHQINMFIICQMRWIIISPSLLLLFVIFWGLISHLSFSLSQIIVPHNIKQYIFKQWLSLAKEIGTSVIVCYGKSGHG